MCNKCSGDSLLWMYEEWMAATIKRANEGGYTCNRPPRPSGAALIIQNDDEFTVIWGDVKPTSGSQSCKDVGCMMVEGHCVRNIHAEVDALLKCAKDGISTKGATMLSVNKPCYACTIACIKAGIQRILYAYTVYDEERTTDAMESAGVVACKIGDWSV